ncbi:hypothetical protein SUNI508_08258 [Seiridium unicorne]|uniref:Uncharacterized protein n=1 Tax=Seiridium unicorne TaxID=138068 RepID=A0ABR2UUE6_9PEZI
METTGYDCLTTQKGIHHHFIMHGTVDEQHDAGGSEEDIQSTSSSSFEATFPYTLDELVSIISYPDQLVEVASEFEWKAKLVDLHPRVKAHTFVLANGYESGSRMMMLNTATGEMEVNMQAYDSYNEGTVGAYLKDLRLKYETLEMVPIPGVEEAA